MEKYKRLTERIGTVVVYPYGKYEDTTIAEMTTSDMRTVMQRLAELEDKIERGELVENTFVTYYNIARSGGKTLTEKALKFDELKAKIDNGTLIELPKKCYQVIWVLGWEIIEYDIVSITYDYDKATITEVIAVCPHSQQVFTNRDLGHFDGIGTHVFFTIAEAEKKLRELQNEKLL